MYWKRFINQPSSGTIDLLSINSRKGSHKRTGSIETSERSDNQSKQRFLVSKKYNQQMVPAKLTLSKDSMKSWLAKSMKFTTNSSSSKPCKNHTNIVETSTPTFALSKMNIKGNLLARKWLGNTQNILKLEDKNSNILANKLKDSKKGKVVKVKEWINQTPNSKASHILQNNDKPSNLRQRGSNIISHPLSTSKRIEKHFGHEYLYDHIIKNKKLM